MNNEKKLFRLIKRQLKKAGSRQRRRFFKDQLRANPNEAQWDEYDDFGNCGTKDMNGMFKDNTRNKEECDDDLEERDEFDTTT